MCKSTIRVVNRFILCEEPLATTQVLINTHKYVHVFKYAMIE